MVRRVLVAAVRVFVQSEALNGARERRTAGASHREGAARPARGGTRGTTPRLGSRRKARRIVRIPVAAGGQHAEAMRRGQHHPRRDQGSAAHPDARRRGTRGQHSDRGARGRLSTVDDRGLDDIDVVRIRVPRRARCDEDVRDATLCGHGKLTVLSTRAALTTSVSNHCWCSEPSSTVSAWSAHWRCAWKAPSARIAIASCFRGLHHSCSSTATSRASSWKTSQPSRPVWERGPASCAWTCAAVRDGRRSQFRLERV